VATPFKRKKILLLGSGELGKEVAIEAMRLGQEVVACDRYEGAPAMQVAHRAYAFPMLDGAKIRKVVEKEQPDLIVPEIEAIATDTLVALEREGYRVIPTARAAQLTMDREGIRRLAAERLKLPTSRYRFASSFAELEASAKVVGFPLRGQTNDVVFRTRSERRQKIFRSEKMLGLCDERYAREDRASDR